MNSDKIILAIALIVVLVALFWLVSLGRDKAECNEQGGVYIQSFIGYECIDVKRLNGRPREK